MPLTDEAEIRFVDERRWLQRVSLTLARPTSIVVVLNWDEDLKQSAPPN